MNETIEEWKTVEGWEDYEVSNLGNVRSFKGNPGRGHAPVRRTIPKPLTPKSNGMYLQVGLSKNGKNTPTRVHRIVAKAFVPNPNNLPVVNHKDGVKTNNRDTNLEWTTGQENHDHAHRNGLSIFGERVGASKLKVDQVIQIKKMIADGISRQTIADTFHVKIGTIVDIALGRTWASPFSFIPAEEHQNYEINKLRRW